MDKTGQQSQSSHHTKRAIAIGFITIVSLVMLFISFSPADATAGCTGDCISCHPVLKGDADHAALDTCKMCHSEEKKKLDIFAMPKNLDGGCGTKCFDCHKEWPKNGYHATLETCKNCHEYAY